MRQSHDKAPPAPLLLQIRMDDGLTTSRTVKLLPTAGEVTVGRRRGLTLQLPTPSVSFTHARIFVRDSLWFVEDLKSANGTWRNGARLLPGRPQPIAEGDTLSFGKVKVQLDAAASDATRMIAEGTASLARQLVADLFGAISQQEAPRLRVTAGPDSGKELVLSSAGRPHRVGRAPDCELVLSDEDCSRTHVAFVRKDTGILVVDLDSKNGVIVNGTRIASELAIVHGAVIQIGGTTLVLDDPEAQYLAQMEAGGDEAQPEVGEAEAVAEAMPEDVPDAPVVVASVAVARSRGLFYIGAFAALVLLGLLAMVISLVF